MIKDIKKELLEQAKKEVEKTTQEKIKQMELTLNNDIEKLERLIGEVENNLLYKSEKYKYILVTKEIIYEDYKKEQKYSGGGIRYNGDFKNYSYYVSVNGEYYYHVGNVIDRHIKDIDEALEKNSWERDKLYEKKQLMDTLKEQHKPIIDMITSYNKYVEDKLSKVGEKE